MSVGAKVEAVHEADEQLRFDLEEGASVRVRLSDAGSSVALRDKIRRGTFSPTPIPLNTKGPVLTCVNFPFLSSPLTRNRYSVNVILVGCG